ncbi:FliH/SctL family protein [Legionella cardiaca]|uniref:Flagellar assembly protein FliH n=1 Tax=Legionella cardiaca TaxID=1071983 RepID=A0ABY8AVM0_9GAMM|nr:FliH/SctL family protein [Legionella cardiaca]WED43794.1 FliH/SctL family protein [Legionella cardiaca]
MDNDFQPLYEEKDKDAFDVWEFKAPDPEPIIEIDPQEEFAQACERLREEAKKQGYQEGMQLAAEELQLQRQELANCLALLKKPITLLDNDLSYELIQTITWVCEVCIGIELSIHPDKLLLLLDEIKKELPSLREDKQLLMNPEDVQWLLENLDKQQATELSNFLVADENLVRGDFYLKSEFSELDGQLKTRLQQIFKKQLSELQVSQSSQPKDSL